MISIHGNHGDPNSFYSTFGLMKIEHTNEFFLKLQACMTLDAFSVSTLTFKCFTSNNIIQKTVSIKIYYKCIFLILIF